MALDGKPSEEEYAVNVAVLQSSILGRTLFLLYINDPPDDIIVILPSMLMILLYSKCDQASDLLFVTP